jgi:starch synthase
MVTQLDDVKGIDLMEPVLEWLLEREAQFVLVGTGENEYHEMLEGFQTRFPDRARVYLKFDDVLARRIYAGADVLLKPSAVEPYGLGQMIAMRYGCVPVVRETGGLADTVTDYTAKRGRGTGFTFANHTADACQDALSRALEVYRKRAAWRRMQKRGMAMDFSWSASAKEYVKLYRQAIETHGS